MRHRATRPARRFSPEQLERRRALIPALRYPEELPVAARRDELLEAIGSNQVVIVAGETGSRKTTQLPKMCLELGRGVAAMIGQTQPRRLAARTVVERLCEELGVPLGQAVGYTVRFRDEVSDDTLIKVMTDGILLAELRRDRQLRRYDTIIVDEAHERSLNIDFLLGYLQRLLPRRPDLKVIVTSATIDTRRFSEHFGGAPIVEVSGRAYPVEVRYQPVVVDEEDRDRDQLQAICDAVDELAAEGPGDILVFLSGEREIRDTQEALAATVVDGTELLPLYARLSSAEQHRVFQSHPGRRIVLATNVAETTLTVPGIRYVIDPGTARISRYSQRTKVQRLPIEPVSRASANQRAGRCGRVAPGICIRLYSEEDFARRPEFTQPEILRTNLAAVILAMTALGLGDIAAFPFVESPDRRQIADGIALLEELEALDRDGGLTPIGRTLAQLPVDPRLGRMVIESDHLNCLREVMVVAAALSIQDPRERPAAHRQEADEQHRRFADDSSDLLTWLNLWRYVRDQQRELSSGQFRRRCRAEWLNHSRLREWQDVYSQLLEAARASQLRVPVRGVQGAVPREAIHRSILAGLLSHIGVRDDSSARRPREYRGARGARFALSPGAVVAKRPPRWIMAAELVETTRMWGRQVAPIEPAWLEQVAHHLLTRSYGDPYWNRERASAVVDERLTLYGLTVVGQRLVGLARVDPEAARRLFIRHALVRREWDGDHGFLAANQAVMDDVAALESRARRRDLLIGEEDLVAWYDRRVGAEVTTGRRFDTWWKQARHSAPDLLLMEPADVIDPQAGPVDRDSYPDSWVEGGLELPLGYTFEPGSADDGVAVHIPLRWLYRVSEGALEWQIPGYRQDLVRALLETLPKESRRAILPAAETAGRFLEGHGPQDGPLLGILARYVAAATGEQVTARSFRLDAVPAHLRLLLRVTGADGRILAASGNLPALRDRLRPYVRALLAGSAPPVKGSTDGQWTFGVLPHVLDVETGGMALQGYPALADEGDGVGLEVCVDPSDQATAMWAGTRRLLLLAAPIDRRHVLRVLTSDSRAAITRSPYGSTDDVLDQSGHCAADELLAELGGPVWDEGAYALLVGGARLRLESMTAEVAALVGAVLAMVAVAEDDIAVLPSRSSAGADMQRQLGRLVYPGFVVATGYPRLPHLLRYLQALDYRARRVQQQPGRDRERQRQVEELQSLLDAAIAARHDRAGLATAQTIRWMLEELRVSLFAQQLGTPEPVSAARVRRALAGLA